MKPYLSYRFRGFLFEFVEDHILITDIAFGKIYKLDFTPNSDIPFHTQLKEILSYAKMRQLQEDNS